MRDALARLSARGATVEHGAAVAPLPKDEVKAQMRLVEAALVEGKVDLALPRVEQLVRSNPEEPEVVAHLGICRNLRGDFSGAIEPLVKAVQLDPKNARALYFLAGSLAALNEFEEAGRVAVRGLELTPRDLNLLVLIGSIYGMVGNSEQAARFLNLAYEYHPEAIAPFHMLEVLGQQTLRRSACYDLSPRIGEARKRLVNRLLAAQRKGRANGDELAALISLLSGSPEHFDTGVELAKAAMHTDPMPTPLAQQIFLIFWAAGETSLAVKLAELCYERDPTRSSYREALCSSWLDSGSEHWNSAWRVLTESQQSSRPGQHLHSVPNWSGQRLGKRKLLVYQEQGFGDAIICFRLLSLLAARGVRFDLWVLPALAELAAQTSGYENLLQAAQRPDPAALGYDYAVPLFGLIPALYLGRDEVKDPPVVRADPNQAPELRQRVAQLPGARVGLVYGGNPDRRDDWLRSVPVEALGAVAAMPGVSWVNLMVDERPDKLRARDMFRMLDPMAEVRNFADTAAVIEELDAVVAVDCSVAHLAGNLAKPLWVLAPPSSDWRWQIGEDTRPWWPTARLLRSEGPGVWTSALRTLEAELAQFVSSLGRG